MKSRYFFLLCLMSVAWAGSYSIFKYLESALTPGEVVTLRFGIAGCVLIAAAPFLPGPRLAPKDWGRSAWIGLLVFVIAPRLQVTGVQWGGAGDASVLMGFEPLITSMAAAFFLKERVPPERWIGFFLGLAGVTLLSRFWEPGRQLIRSGTANLLIIASFVFETAYSILGKPLLARNSLVKILAVALGIGTAANLLWDGANLARIIPGLSIKTWLCILYLALVCTLVGYILWYAAMRKAEVNLLALTVFIQPFAGLLFSSTLLGEPLHWGQFWGGLAILAGVCIGVFPEMSKRCGRDVRALFG